MSSWACWLPGCLPCNLYPSLYFLLLASPCLSHWTLSTSCDFFLIKNVWFFIYVFIYLISSCLSTSFLFSQSPLLFLRRKSTPPQFLFRKAQVSHEYQQNISNQVAIRLSTSQCIKVGQGDPVWRAESPKPIKELEIDAIPLKGPSYTAITYMQRT